MNRRSFFGVFRVLAVAPVLALLPRDVEAEQLEVEVRPDLLVFVDTDGRRYGVVVSSVGRRQEL